MFPRMRCGSADTQVLEPIAVLMAVSTTVRAVELLKSFCAKGPRMVTVFANQSPPSGAATNSKESASNGRSTAYSRTDGRGRAIHSRGVQKLEVAGSATVVSGRRVNRLNGDC